MPFNNYSTDKNEILIYNAVFYGLMVKELKKNFTNSLPRALCKIKMYLLMHQFFNFENTDH